MASSPTPSVPSADSRARIAGLREALANRVVVADGAMGTMLQAQDPTMEDFQDLEGCNEVLNVTRPDIVRSVHEAYFDAGVDCVETNTFGANQSALGEYEIADRIHELSEAGARIAREVADAYTASGGGQRWVLGSIGPGTKLPTLGHAPYITLRDGFQANAEGLIAGGADALLVETTQDLLQTKAAILGSRRAMEATGIELPLLCSMAFETTGTMLLGSEIGAALTALEPLGIDMIGLNCSTGPAEMSEHLRYLARHSRIPLLCMPNAGLPVLGKDGAYFPLDAEGLADAQETFVQEYGLSLIGGCCGTTPEHLRQVVERVRGLTPPEREPRPEPGAASLYQTVPFRQDTSYLAIGERTNANGSKKFRDAMLEARWDDCVEMARDQIREGAHMLDLCVDYVGRDGVADMAELAGRFATASTLPIVLDSTEVDVIRAGLEKLGGRAVINSVNYEDGDGPESRFAQVTRLAQEHGAALIALTIDEEGQARTVENKVAVAQRLIADLTGNWGIHESDILVDTLTFTICTGQEESRRDGVHTIEAIRELKRRHPDVQTTLGLSNISFGLNPAARILLNSVFLDECVKAGLDSAIVHASKILPIARFDDEQVGTALDLIYDRRREDYDPLQKLMELFEGVDTKSLKAGKAQELLSLPLEERLQRRIIDGEKNGLEADLDEALRDRPALDIVNETLLEGMKVVGELFGSGRMQLPFVLQSAEVMKNAVAHLEPHMEKSDAEGKGTIVLATVRGDVHDIGKNLVDIILSNNGYNVVNLGIKQPVSAILEAAEEHRADVIGMSGLLVKSTVIMKENLEEMNQRKIAADYPVILGGAALTRAYVEQDLHELYEGEVRYARDAFEGLRLMDALIGVKRGVPGAALPELKQRRVRPAATAVEERPEEGAARSDVAVDNPVPEPPFWGTRVIKGIQLKEYASWLDEGALFKGQWGLKQNRTGDGPSYEELVETEGRPRLRGLLDQLHTRNLLEAAVVYGYFPCVSKGDDLIVLNEDGSERTRFSFPRQRRGRRLCLADFFRPEESGQRDVVGFQVVTVGSKIGEATAELFAGDAYRDYLELHGLSVQLAEALAEYWHARVRAELGFGGEDPDAVEDMFALKYRGARFSLGYGACPDLEDRAKIAELLQPERIGVRLSEEFQLHPEQSTDAIVIHHPEAKYFNAR
ncbi:MULTISPECIES: methionine synthase [Streptomyces]|uniref:Methionine synthase n=1 Tax=Streptomyces tsukubensis (strain DSM 42081 / NBRC 108919 / NRRL 18488 / 9993) TaxID=1114943 RepID=I2MVQ3_STRT9|nr:MULTISPECIES: methionine synthase [Streptomyces]AZK93307.1 methionine synthase [Streptomyces tsukubensis]EIF88850.1 5-methyltetrahydrofolate:homocysteine S-methyltransferase [Streptomyces tsukubensis NRRL18488]MYS63038.1 methionine synthase [Streptomyces sp. SID5473]QKM70539.1 methionine synthase [Streptomyces tsukubensis NRRL18488]TAI40552.1 methionine synthase [Streptomyces tsukubensis]